MRNEEALKKLINMYSELEAYLLDEIIKHFNYNEEFINSDYWKASKLEELGLLNDNILKYIAKVTNRTPREIKDAFEKIGYNIFNENNLNEAYIGGLIRINPSILVQNNVVHNLIENSYNETTKRFLEISKRVENATRESYLNVVEKTYLQMTSGGITYQEAIRNSLVDLGNKGITTLTYKVIDDDGNVKGLRNYDIEGTVRRELITATNNLTNKINEKIADDLDVEYIYLSEHICCRPTHFPWQGTVIRRKELVNVTKYGEVDGLGGVNCHHYATPYFGTARGTELKRISLEEATEQYKLSQEQRYLERGIRKWKRKERIFKRSSDKEYYKKCKDKVQEWQLRNKKFIENNNLKRDFSRENVEKITRVVNSNIEKEQYVDITTRKLLEKYNNYEIEEQKYFVDNNGSKYNVDGKKVILEPTDKEKEVANLLGEIYGGKVRIIPRINEPAGIKTPDYMIENRKYDLKEIYGNSKNTLYNAIAKKKEQSDNFIFDISNTKMNIIEAINQIQGIYKSKHKDWVNEIILIKNNQILKMYKRK
jgi:hypothetical protein